MTFEEAGELLAFIATVENRDIGDNDVAAWMTLVGDQDFTEARNATAAYYRQHSRNIRPADVRQRVEAARKAIEDQHQLRTLTDHDAYRREIDGKDAAFLRKLAMRTGRPVTLKAIDDAS